MENNLLDLGYGEIKAEIRNNISNMVLSFIDVGYWLKQIRDKELFKEDGYKNVYDMAQAEFNMSRTVVSRFMSINDKYSVGGNSRELLEQFQGFGKSALTEMLSLPVEDYELLTPDTKVEDIRELKEAERKLQEEQDGQIDQVEGQMNILNDMPDIVPEADKPEKKEADISEAIRELFRPREMKEYLDKLVNMDPESNAMDWWVADFNAAGNRTFKHIPFFLFFYGKEEGLKIKNIFKNTIEQKTYQDFYYMVRAAYPQETVRGTDVWMQAYGEEWKKQQEQEAAEQEKAAARKEKTKKKEKSSKKVDSIQSPAVLPDEKKRRKPQKAVRIRWKLCQMRQKKQMQSHKKQRKKSRKVLISFSLTTIRRTKKKVCAISHKPGITSGCLWRREDIYIWSQPEQLIWIHWNMWWKKSRYTYTNIEQTGYN